MSVGTSISTLMSVLRKNKPQNQIFMAHDEVCHEVVEAIKYDYDIFQLIIETVHVNGPLTWNEMKAILRCSEWEHLIFGRQSRMYTRREGAWSKIRANVWKSLLSSPEVVFHDVHLAHVPELHVFIEQTYAKDALLHLFEIIDFMNKMAQVPSIFDWQLLYLRRGHIDYDTIKKCLLQISVYPKEGQRKLGEYLAGLKTEQQLNSFHEQMKIKKSEVIASILV